MMKMLLSFGHKNYLYACFRSYFPVSCVEFRRVECLGVDRKTIYFIFKHAALVYRKNGRKCRKTELNTHTCENNFKPLSEPKDADVYCSR